MVKKNVLTPVLAGVLGLSIVGSGVGYYMVNKDGGNGADKGKSKSSTNNRTGQYSSGHNSCPP